MRKILLLIVPVAAIFYWQRALTPESTTCPTTPMDVVAFGENRSVMLTWNDPNWCNSRGYVIFYGSESGEYTDSAVVYDSLRCRIPHLKDDAQYYFSVLSFNRAGRSERSDEVSAKTYFCFEGFDQYNGPLDPDKWHSETGYITPVSNRQVEAAEIEQYLGKIKKSYGQYRLTNPTHDVTIECQFKIGYPNVGGAGVMLRAEKASSGRYYKGYTGYIFWTGEQWELRLEENKRDRQAVASPTPVILPSLKSNSWVKVCLEKRGKILTARVYDLATYSLLGTVRVEEKKHGFRPRRGDIYCGFYTCQYGGNTIVADNFGLRHLMHN